MTVAGIILQQKSWSESTADQHWYPVAYWSRKKTPAERNYGIGDSEGLAIVEACKQWRHYLEGSKYPIELQTDHANHVRFMESKPLNGRQARWWEFLSRFRLAIKHKPGKENPADAPSRRPDYMLEETPETPQASPMQGMAMTSQDKVVKDRRRP